MNKETDTDKGLVAEWLKMRLWIGRMMEPMPWLRWFIDPKQKLMPTVHNPREQLDALADANLKQIIREAKAQAAEKQATIDRQQQIRDENKKNSYFGIAIMAFIGSLPGAILVMRTAIDDNNSLYWLSWIAFGVLVVMIILSSIAVFKYWPGRQSIRSLFVRFGKRIWRLVKRA